MHKKHIVPLGILLAHTSRLPDDSNSDAHYNRSFPAVKHFSDKRYRVWQARYDSMCFQNWSEYTILTAEAMQVLG